MSSNEKQVWALAAALGEQLRYLSKIQDYSDADHILYELGRATRIATELNEVKLAPRVNGEK